MQTSMVVTVVVVMACAKILGVESAAVQAAPAPSPSPAAAPAPKASPKASWADSIKMKGDFRFRYEEIDDSTAADQRYRERIRLRLGLDAKVNDNTKVIAQLATDEDGDPISTNQTLTNGFTKKSFYLDQAYVEWKPGAFEVDAGKMKMPFYKVGDSQLIWDSDLTPEGMAGKFTSAGDIAEGFGALGYLPVVERKTNNDTMVLGAQAGVKFKFQNWKSYVMVGASMYDYGNIQGRPVIDYTATNKSYGNTKDGSNNYVYDYDITEIFFESSFKVAETPLAVYAQSVSNGDPSTKNKGYLVGFSVGKLSKPGTWAFKYNYRKLEADAVVGAFCDSDFSGGGTNGKGSVVGFDIQTAKNAVFSLTYLMNDKNLATPADYNRLQVDFSVKF